MALREYKYTINNIEHTLQLSDEDAKLRGLDPDKDAISGDIPPVESPLGADDDAKAKAKTPANKAATPENK